MDIRAALLLFIALDALVAIPFMLVARRQFATRGRWSRPVAAWSGLVMHGQAVATLALAWVDRGTLFAPGAPGVAAGIAFGGLGIGILAAGRAAYGSQKRVYGLLEDELVARGIYRWSRNPQYLGYGSLFLGAALASGSAWALASTAVFAAVVHVFVTAVEEPHLARAFGAPYAAYRARVRRYV